MGADGGEGTEADARPARRVTAIEALEAYSSDHPETVDQLLEWPYRRWLAAFAAWTRRKAIEAVDRRQEAHVAALYANCVELKAQIFTKRGWLAHDEVQVGDFTIGYNVTTNRNEWTRVIDVHHTMTPVPTIELGNGNWSLRTTPDHRWLTKAKGVGNAEFRTIETFDWSSMVVMSAEYHGVGLPISDDEAELIGWVIGDGCVAKHPQPKHSLDRKFNLWIYQAKIEQVNHLNALMQRFECMSEIVDAPGFKRTLPLHRWRLATEHSIDIYRRAGLHIDKSEGLMDFILSLSRSQLERFMEAIWLAEGVTQGKNGRGHSQKSGPIADALEIGVYLLGRRPAKCKRSDQGLDRWTWAIPRFRAKHLKISKEDVEPVWCVTTELGSWTARNDRSVFLTGNTNMDSEQNDREGVIAKLNEYYNQLRDIVGRDPEEVRRENERLRQMEESDPFLRAGRRNLHIVAPQDPIMPGEERIKQFA